MGIESILEAITKQAANVAPFGAKLKFVLGEDVILIDGTGDSNIVSQNDEEAACTISTEADTFLQLKNVTESNSTIFRFRILNESLALIFIRQNPARFHF